MPVAFYTKDEIDALIVSVSSATNFTIVEVTAGEISPNNLQTPIPRSKAVTIALCTSTSINNAVGVELPAGADVGDIVEIHNVVGDGLAVYHPPGETLYGATNLQKSVPQRGSRVFRKISATDWRMVGAE
jgi:hypothetical protein